MDPSAQLTRKELEVLHHVRLMDISRSNVSMALYFIPQDPF